MKNALIYQSTQDIPFIEAQVNIHQPTINEIALISENNFWMGSQLLNFTAEDRLSKEDSKELQDMTDFEVLMSILMDKNKQNTVRHSAKLVLTLLFPDYQIAFKKSEIVLTKDDFSTSINNDNFNAFKKIITQMFGLNGSSSYDPLDGPAKRIAEKFKKREAILSKNKTSSDDVSLLDRYVSILAVGESKNKNELMNYTVHQLKDEFKRYTLKLNFDMQIEAKMAGAQGLDEAENWMDDIRLEDL